MSGWSHSHVGPIFTSNKIKIVEIGKEWNVDLNFRPDEAIRGKQSIFGWKGQREGCGYSELQVGSTRLCQLRTVCSGPLNEHLIMYSLHAGFMGSSKPT
jgi:hypothetical protein